MRPFNMSTANPTLFHPGIARFFVMVISLFSLASFAQETGVENKNTKAASAEASSVKPNDAAVNKPEAKSAPTQAAKKMVQDATINLQTTITGNQEQPRVLYILPWQSPQTADVDFEPLDSQHKAVFGHVEREELRRELESSGELE